MSSSCDHHWEESEGFAKCRKCKQVTKASLVMTKKGRVTTCALCYGNPKLRENMIDQWCPGCKKGVSEYTPPKSYMGFPLEEEEDALDKALEDIAKYQEDKKVKICELPTRWMGFPLDDITSIFERCTVRLFTEEDVLLAEGILVPDGCFAFKLESSVTILETGVVSYFKVYDKGELVIKSKDFTLRFESPSVGPKNYVEKDWVLAELNIDMNFVSA